jgi:hypothetical protein
MRKAEAQWLKSPSLVGDKINKEIPYGDPLRDHGHGRHSQEDGRCTIDARRARTQKAACLFGRHPHRLYARSCMLMKPSAAAMHVK